jgi:transcriptional regulator with XRE-family HTH domain
MIPQKWLGELYGLHRNYIGAVERAEWTPSIVAADRLARALGRTLSEMLAEVEREEGRLRRLEETLSGDRGPTPVARISNAPWSGRCLPGKAGRWLPPRRVRRLVPWNFTQPFVRAYSPGPYHSPPRAPARWTPATSLHTTPPHSVLKVLLGQCRPARLL